MACLSFQVPNKKQPDYPFQKIYCFEKQQETNFSFSYTYDLFNNDSLKQILPAIWFILAIFKDFQSRITFGLNSAKISLTHLPQERGPFGYSILFLISGTIFQTALGTLNENRAKFTVWKNDESGYTNYSDIKWMMMIFLQNGNVPLYVSA